MIFSSCLPSRRCSGKPGGRLGAVCRLVLPCLLSLSLLTACGTEDADNNTAPSTQQQHDANASVNTNTAQLELAETDLFLVHAGEIEQTLSANGTLHARQETVVRAKVAGEILSVAVREGEYVSAGQTLAKIDDIEYQARLDDRQAALAAGQAQAALAESTRSKNEELRQKNFLSDLAYDNAQSAASVAQAQLQSLQAQLTLAEKALHDTVVRAPISGWIAERAIERGDKTPPDGKLFTIVDLSRLEMKALVPAHAVAQVAIGQPFTATVEGYATQQFKGRIARIGAQALPGSRAITIYIEFPNPQATIKAGLFAAGSLTLGHSAAQALVPLTALHSATGTDFVYAVIDGKIQRTPVSVGMRSEAAGLAEITDGLTPGTRIVAANLGPLKEGASIRIVNTAKPANTGQAASAATAGD